ncbi:unnamed protein product [Bemisia tabaci]|uniref:C2H2-type domain-containing protein n=2 Tax=Bemisia tabaci TaxID=7038 RepID=A0A9P0A9I6_BEMTA|nr:unnamed protein product [Bemisia tabaci]
MDPANWNRMIGDVNTAYQQCYYITAQTDRGTKRAASQTCEDVFRTLDIFRLNECHGWYDAKCRLIPPYDAYQCSVKTPACALMEPLRKAQTLAECAPTLFQPNPTNRPPSPSPTSSRSSRQRGKESRGGTSGRWDTAGASGSAGGSPSRGRGPSRAASPSRIGGSSHAGGSSPRPSFSIPATPAPAYARPDLTGTGLVWDPNFRLKDFVGPGGSPGWGIPHDLAGASLPGSPFVPANPPVTVGHGLALDPEYSVGDLSSEAEPQYGWSESYNIYPQGGFSNLDSNVGGSSEVGSKVGAVLGGETQGSGPFKCAVCGNTYEKKKTYQNHMTSHRKFSAGETICHCGKQLASMESLWQHKEVVHGEYREVKTKEGTKCTICDEDFGTSANWYKHDQIVHKGKGQCPYCPLSLTSLSGIAKHIKTYHPEKSTKKRG